ncbi:MAG: hypothetical protein R2845_15075 [Thermomicrobiales bacterium]
MRAEKGIVVIDEVAADQQGIDLLIDRQGDDAFPDRARRERRLVGEPDVRECAWTSTKVNVAGTQ